MDYEKIALEALAWIAYHCGDGIDELHNIMSKHLRMTDEEIDYYEEVIL